MGPKPSTARAILFLALAAAASMPAPPPSPPRPRRAPVRMRLYCPACGAFHVDRGEWATREHRTHLCEACGHEWRPREYATVGVDRGESVDV